MSTPSACRVTGGVAAVLLLFAACGPEAPAPTSAPENTGTGSDRAAAERADDGNDEKEPGLGEGSASKGARASSAERGRAQGHPGRVAAEGGGEDDGSSAWYPAAGLYTYGQSGYEEFCDASGCERRDLPPRQDVKTTYERRSGGKVVVVTEAEASDSRLVRTTTEHTRAGAKVTKVFLRFDYENVSFDNSYEPAPPVEIVRLPLQGGATWSGTWSDSTSGDYDIRVGRRVALTVAGRTVQAFPIHVVTDFRGDFEGRATTTVWVDPATAAVVRSEGEMDLDSFFGTYRTRFRASLRTGPDYR